jgi:hypothetical protein
VLICDLRVDTCEVDVHIAVPWGVKESHGTDLEKSPRRDWRLSKPVDGDK